MNNLRERRIWLDGLATLSLLLTELLLGECRGIGVETQQNLLVLERVLLQDVTTLRACLASGCAQHRLDFGAVDKTGQVRLRDNVRWQEEVLLECRGLGGGAVDLVEGLEGGRGPDNKSAKVTTGGELQQVQGEHGAGLDTGDVAEAQNELLAVDLRVVDDQGSTALSVTATTQLSLSCTELLGALDLLQIGTGTDGLQETESSRGLGVGGTIESGGVDNERDLRNGHDLVATGEQQRGDSRSSESGSGSESPERILENGNGRGYRGVTHF